MKRSSSSLFFAVLLCFFLTPAIAQWERQYPLEKLEPVLDIALHDDNYGFAVGNNDLIIRLDTATDEWIPLDSWNKGWQLKAVDYLEGSNGNFVAAAGNGMIIS